MKKVLTIIFICLAGSGLLAQTATPPAAGDGTVGNPYQIATINNLYWISQNSSMWYSYFIQTANIDASETSTWFGGEGFVPIGESATNKFRGNYDGNGYTISGLTINRPTENYIGLFGTIDYANISNLGIIDCSIHGKLQVGGLVGQAIYSEISNCFTTGSVTAADNSCGGLIGYAWGGMLNYCYSKASVSGIMTIGGFAGWSRDVTFTNCYCTGSVPSGQYTGGFIGLNQSGSTADNCFWNTESSGKTTSDLGTGKTTAEMKMQSTYTGWDFANTWAIQDDFNDGYPYLQWQPVPVVFPMPISDWAIYFGIFLILAFSVYRFKRFSF